MFEVGQRVVCQNDDFPIQVWDWFNQVQIRGPVYTAMAVALARDYLTGEEGLKLSFDGIVSLHGANAFFAAWRFRPFYAPVAVNMARPTRTGSPEDVPSNKWTGDRTSSLRRT